MVVLKKSVERMWECREGGEKKETYVSPRAIIEARSIRKLDEINFVEKMVRATSGFGGGHDLYITLIYYCGPSAHFYILVTMWFIEWMYLRVALCYNIMTDCAHFSTYKNLIQIDDCVCINCNHLHCTHLSRKTKNSRGRKTKLCGWNW